MTTLHTSDFSAPPDPSAERGSRRFVVVVSGEGAQRAAQASGSLFGAASDLIEIVVGHLVRHGAREIMLDLSAVTFDDDDALRVLLEYRHSLTKVGVVLVFADPPLA
jgi:hypothetical protein